jgi:hypothetical protein
MAVILLKLFSTFHGIIGLEGCCAVWQALMRTLKATDRANVAA